MRTVLLLLLFVAAACAPRTTVELPPEPAPSTPPPDAPREFRAAWVATVANIDWPTRPGLPAAQQQAELRALLDRAVLLNMNAVVLQVRPMADALYDSALEPWSEFLTGASGKPPEPYYDPLAFAVDEAHRRGLELHAWFNPFRAGHPGTRSKAAPSHVSRRDTAIVRTYGTYLWMDPGEPAARAQSLAVIRDVVQRYDVDGVHFDDYFYPYPVQNDAGREVPFPDDASWARARAAGTTLSRDDWRRQNINRFIEDTYNTVKAEKPWVKVGISPFGIWRPDNPPGIRGFDAYAGLYADARLWLQEGWVDYITPQLYWQIERPNLEYPKLLQWWAEQNTRRRHLWPGNFTSRTIAEGDRHWPDEEIVEQVRRTRANPDARGNVHFSMKALMPQHGTIGERLLEDVYRVPALVPPSPWLDADAPAAPDVAFEHLADRTVLLLTPPPGETAWRWVVRTRCGPTWRLDLLPGWRHITPATCPTGATPDEAAVSFVDRTGNESGVTRLRLAV